MTLSLKEIREEIIADMKSTAADVFKGRLSALYFDEKLRTKLTSYTEEVIKKGIEEIEAANEGEPASEYENGFDFGMIAAAKVLQSLTENTNV